VTIVISPAVRSYPDDDETVDVLPCTECLDLLEVVELTDCGTHTLCPACLASSPCSACHAIRSGIAADLADQRAYDTWRDEQTREDIR
jgi:hypothetical protein